MSLVVPRTCTELGEQDSSRGSSGLAFSESRPLSDYRSTPAFVLLGDPGSGKTTEFERECEQSGNVARMISARDFVALDVDLRSEWSEKVLFIDGLDEMRAGTRDARTPLDEIRSRLDRLRPPGFRISCREADWLGNSDRRSLDAVSPDDGVTVLRLDPLSEQSAIELLESRPSVTDGQAFVAEAHRLGLAAMLGNPLTLKLLEGSVCHRGHWPATRREAFEGACRQMATEANDEHRIGAGVRPTETMLDAAGWLCALHLLSGFVGYWPPSGPPSPRAEPSGEAPPFVALVQLAEPPDRLERGDLERALTTKLFTADGGGLVPLHRQVAEFLAGRYLAKLIQDGLPSRRVVALLTSPSDERVVASLRGLSAWLAPHSGEARPLLIAADPVGVGLYGDISGFSAHEKKQLLESLARYAEEGPLLGHQRRDGRNQGYRDDTAWAFRGLATAEMVPAMRELLSDVHADDTRERLATLILEVLAGAEDPTAVAGLEEELEAILWTESVSGLTRQSALDAYVHVVPVGDKRTNTLRRLLDAAHDGTIPDPSDNLRGRLLEELYPKEVTPSEVWRYALGRNGHDHIARFWWFYYRTLLEESSAEQLVILLESLRENALSQAPALGGHGWETLPVEILARCLEASGDNQAPERLYRWLATVDVLRRYAAGGQEAMSRVRSWLEARPQVQKEIVLAWLRQRDPDESKRSAADRWCEALHDSRRPKDFGLWCLEQAIAVADSEPEVSKGLISEAYWSLSDPSTSVNLTIETLRERTSAYPSLAQHLDELSAPRSSSGASADREHRQRMEEREREWNEKKQREREDWARHLHEEEDDLLENRFGARNLHTLAHEYLGDSPANALNESREDRIRDLIGDDDRLLAAVMAAIRGAAWRDDVPEVDETVKWSRESRLSGLALPVLASLSSLDNEDPARLDGLPEAQRRKALAIYYCTPRGATTPGWHQRWLQEDPEMVLDVLFRCAVAAIRAGAEYVPGLNDLDGVKGYDDLVHAVRLRLLAAFPTRSANKQLPVLDRLLAKALEYPDKAQLLDLARQKQAARSMPVAQRIRWCATDALIVQGTRMSELRDDLASGEVRVWHLAEFLRSVSNRFGGGRSILSEIRDPSTLGELVEVLGTWCSVPEERSGYVTLEMETADLIGRLIGQLSSQPGEDAREVLASLVENPRLEGWRQSLDWAQQEQRVVRREASYRIPTIEQVQHTLSGGSPANPADLKALLEYRLGDIDTELRGGNSDPWRQFWNEDRHGRLVASKPENSCRDALLTMLKPRVPEIDANREGSYAASTSSDIRVCHRGFNVPIEIKKDSHRDLWTAIPDQLMAKYTTDPDADGYGIYLVLWFAERDKPVTRHPDGFRPTTPEELQRLLEQSLTRAEADKISVIVLDVTNPGP